MARIRSIKPELRTSLTVGEWPREVRYAWVLLWGYLDDCGRGKDDLRLLRADLFPLDSDITERKLNSWLDLMCQPGGDDGIPALCRYHVDGRAYLHAVKWSHHQRVSHPRPSRIPACPHHSSSGDPPESFANASGTVPEDVRNGSGSRVCARVAPADQGREQGTGKGIPTSSGADAPREPPPPAEPDEPPASDTTQAILAEWIDRCPKRPPETVISQIGRHVKALLAEGQDPDDVRRGLAAWMSKGLHPAALPSVVNEVMNGARASPRPSTADQAVMDAQALKPRFRNHPANQRRIIAGGAT